MHQIISHLENGLPYPAASFIVCIRDIPDAKDEEVLARAGLLNVRPGLSGLSKFAIYVCRSANWTIILDNWGYDCYHIMMLARETGSAQIDQLGKKHEMFQGVFSDSDQSFAYYYFNEGELQRVVEVTDPHYRGPELGKATGKLMPGEEKHFDIHNDRDTIINLAAELGIRFPEDLSAYRPYTYDPPPAALKAYWWMQ